MHDSILKRLSKEMRGTKELTVSARDTIEVEKRDDNQVYQEIQVAVIVVISQLRDPIRNLEKIQDRGRRLRRRKEMVQGIDAVVPEPLRAKSS